MRDDDQDIRAFLEDEALRAPRPSGVKAETVGRARRRRTAVGLSSLLLVATMVGGALAATGVLDGATPDRPPVGPADSTSGPSPDESGVCPPVVVEGGYRLRLTPASASPGDVVVATGPIPMYREDGSYSPPRAGDAVHLWLDADREEWVSLLEPGLRPDESPGDGVRYLGSQSLASAAGCDFSVELEVPDVAAGPHSVVPVILGDNGAAPYDDAVLDVTEPTIETIRSGGFPRAIEVGEDYVWFTVEDEDLGPAVKRIDRATNEVVDALPLESAGDLGVGAGAVWVIGNDYTEGPSLLRINSRTNALEEVIPLECSSDVGPPRCSPGNVAVDDAAVWVTLSSPDGLSGEVVRVDPVTNRVADRIPEDEGGPRDVVLGGGSLWVNVLDRVDGDTARGGSLVRVDPATGSVVEIAVGNVSLGGDEFPPVMTADEDEVWVVKHESRGSADPGLTQAVRLDAKTGDVISETGNLIPDAIGPGVSPFGIDAESMWFYGGGDVAVRRLDPSTMEVEESIHFGDHAINAIDAELDVEGGVIWFAPYEGPLLRIDLP